MYVYSPNQRLGAITMFETGIGLIFGFTVGLLIQLILNWKAEWNRRMNLRRALLAELESTKVVLHQASDQSQITYDALLKVCNELEDEDLNDGLTKERLYMIERFYNELDELSAILDDIPRTVYESNAGSIGRLSKTEVKMITRFYSESGLFRFEGRYHRRYKLRALSDLLPKVLEDQKRTNRLEGNLNKTITTIDNALEKWILVAVYKTMIHKKDRYRSVLNHVRCPKSFDDLSREEFRSTIAIGHFFNTNSFDFSQYKTRVNSDEGKNLFDSDTKLYPKRRTLWKLWLRNLLERRDGAYVLTQNGRRLVEEHYYDSVTQEYFDVEVLA